MKIALILIWSCLLSLRALSAGEYDHLGKILVNLAPKLDHKQLKEFKYKDCKTQKEKWLLLFAAQIPFEETIEYSSNCFLEGKFTAKMGEFFPISLNVAHLKGITQISGKMKIAIIFTDKTILKLEFIKGSYLNEKKKVEKEFQLAYSFEIDPLNPTKIIKKDLGGKLDLLSQGKILKSIKLSPSQVKP